MKIAMFTDSYYPAVDGVVTSLSTVSRELERIGHEVFIFAPEPSNGEKVQDITKGGTFFFRSFRFRHYPQYRSAFLPSNENRILKRLGVDIIHTHGMTFMGLKGLSAGRHFGVPVATTYHTIMHEAADYYNPLPLPSNFMVNFAVRWARFFLNRLDAVVVPTRPILEELVRLAPRMPYTAVIPTGVDTNRFRPTKGAGWVREKYGLDGSPLLLYVGRVAHEKNIESIIRNMPHISDRSAKLMIVGDGPARKHLEREVHSLNLENRVLFTGFIPDSMLVDYYSVADVFISASKFETQGLSMLEAMSCGKPVVSINYRAVTDFIVDGENGFLYDEFSNNMPEMIDRALSSDTPIRKNARRTAERYSKEKTAKSLSDLYSRVMDIYLNGQ